MNSGIFWAVAGVMMAAVVTLLLLPLLRVRKASTADSRRLANASIYKDQLAELGRERDAGALSAAHYRDSCAELERRLLEDTAGTVETKDAPSKAAVKSAMMILLVIPLVSVPLYLWLGKPAALEPMAAAAAHGEDTAPSMADLDKLAAGLAAKLEANPGNTQGWIMLGRTYKILGRFDEAEKAYLSAGDKANAEPSLILERVELAAQRSNGQIEGPALKLLNQVLKKEPDNLQAIYLSGLGAFNRNDFRGAVGQWERLLKKVPADSQDAREISTAIAEARSRLGGVPVMAPAQAPVAAPEAASSAASVNTASISGKVVLAPAIAAKASPGDTLFVFARAIEGPRMPLAIVRATVADLPLKFNLDDSSAMTPQTRLSGFKSVRLEARISKTGNAMGQPGDLSGSLDNVSVGASGQILTINRVLP